MRSHGSASSFLSSLIAYRIAAKMLLAENHSAGMLDKMADVDVP
jgi:hypothetical protein